MCSASESSWDPNRPYQELPPLPPAQDVEPPDVLRQVVEARAVLAKMDEAARRLPNPEVLLSALTVLEAQASSEIENVVTTTDELFSYMDHLDEASPDVKEALRYRDGLFRGVEIVEERGTLTRATAETICGEISGRSMTLRRTPGTIIASALTGAPVYTPPEGFEVIDRKMGEWENYVNSPGAHDPLVRMALSHYQFEAIHPFDDGNGRTGRILAILQLINEGMLSRPTLYLSRYIIAHKRQYYSLLRRVTEEGDFVAWIRFILDAVQSTARSTVLLIDELQAVEEQLKRVAADALPAGGNLWFVETLMMRPYTRMAAVQQRCGVSRPTARKWLSAMVDAGVLRRMEKGRDVLFVHDGYLEVLANA
ncbi:Fic family protein [Nesterenkonia halobia]|uniref:Fic family protein n=1 Tax=Nesterenkonia halobia TaxID=37922 RepID=A0ABP6R970_9MICC